MARRKTSRARWPGIALKTLVLLALAGGVFAWMYGAQARGFGRAGTGYAAQTVCSCRHVAGRDMGSCKADLLPDTWAIWLSEDEEAQSVSATLPLVASTTSTYRDGFGCVLEGWEG